MADFKSRIPEYGIYLIFLALCYFPIFLHLDSYSIRMWDESMYSVSAYEMYENNNFLVKYSGGTPDMHNTKPPFMIWIQVLMMYILGCNELALRLPSALSTLIIVILIIQFSKTEFKRKELDT